MKTLLLTLLLVPMMSFGQNNYSMSFDGYLGSGNDNISISGLTSSSSIRTYEFFIFAEPHIPNINGQGSIFHSPHYSSNTNWSEIINFDGDNDFNIRVGFNANPSSYCYWDGDGEYSYNQWHHVVVEYNSNGQISLYVNGSLNSLDPVDVQNCSSSYQLWDDIILGQFNGNLSHFSVFDYSLTQQEIQDYMSCPPTGTESGLVGYWNFEEGSGTTALDLTSNGNDGTINGATYSTDVPVQNCCTPNPIATQPANQSVNIGDDANISFTDNLTSASYQWQMDSGTGFTNLSNAGQFSGSDSQSLTISSTTMNNNNTLYRCILTESSCQDTTDVVTLTVVNNVGIGELNNTPKQLIKIVDVLGRETPFKPNTPLLYIYNDGTVERKMIIE